MYFLPAELALVVSFVAAANPAKALPHVSLRDDDTLCSGGLAPLNTNGQSPGSIYGQLQATCSNANTNASLCRCNLIAYNLRMADELCQENNITAWPEWSNNNQCSSNTAPAAQVPYDTSSISIPKWAYQSLSSTMSFDLEAALPNSKGWSAMQIATPIIVAVIVLVLASIAFFLYRRHKQQGSIMYKQPRKAWEDAKLHGPRRFFGLLPETLKVKPRKARDERWEIDDNKVLDEPSPPLETASAQRNAYTPSMHSRSTSVTSLLSSHSPSTLSKSGGIFSAIASKFSLPSLNRTYQSGTSKGPDYKRVQVHSGQPDRQVGIDGGALSPRDDRPSTSGGRWSPSASQSPPLSQSVSAPTPAAEPASRESTMPSVFDIRGPGPRSTVISAGARTGTGTGTGTSSYGHRSYMNSDMLVPDDETVDFMMPAVARSDYSLRSSDLQTPVTPARDTAAAALMSSKISPGSPFLPPERYTSLNAFAAPSPVAHRHNESKDSLAYELYPRTRP